QRQVTNAGGEFGVGDNHGEADAKSVGDVGFDQVNGADLDAGEPIDAQSGQALLELFADGLGARHADEGFQDFVAFPQFGGAGNGAGLLDQQHQWQRQQVHGMDPGSGRFFDQGHGQVQFLFLQPAFEFRLVALAQRDFEMRKNFAQLLEQLGQMVPQDDRGG